MSYKYVTSDLKELKGKGLCGSGTECVVLIPGILSQVCAGGVDVDKGGFATGAVGLNQVARFGGWGAVHLTNVVPPPYSFAIVDGSREKPPGQDGRLRGCQWVCIRLTWRGRASPRVRHVRRLCEL